STTLTQPYNHIHHNTLFKKVKIGRSSSVMSILIIEPLTNRRKGVLAHITEITDNEKLDIAYLNYLDNDEISSIINEDLIQVIDNLEVG
ncbi:hypothetical protein, partial [Staphylococcus delphini]|uniref:hypothetical protein n=1 Tax=Staphylococcus delphini TaxID=53344 RepID=UPI0039C95ED8